VVINECVFSTSLIKLYFTADVDNVDPTYVNIREHVLHIYLEIALKNLYE